MPKSYYATTPIYYVNDKPHIGHAYTTVAGDVLTRWHRQRGETAIYLTGTDEHGTKVERRAEQEGMAPQEWVDKLVSEHWQPVLETINVANDDFIRTTQERHENGVRKFWTVLKDKGFVYPSKFEGPYCVGCEEFKVAADLIDGTGEYEGQQVCRVHERPVETLSEENWFFRLSEFTQPLLDFYAANPQFVAPSSAYNEVVSFIKEGLTDISMSRSSVSWGVSLPWDEEQVVYVWFDALLNYMTAIGYGDEERTADFEAIWPADVHLIGKDILRFHAVFWPAMLLAAELPLPKQVFAHGWLLVRGEKMSKTKLTGISPDEIVDVFGSDAFRYYFLSAINFGSDGSFSWEDLQDRYTAELANGLGNLASRAVAMVIKYFDGKVPQVERLANDDMALRDGLLAAVTQADAAMDRLEFHEAIAALRRFVDQVNTYVTAQEPWQLAKDPEAQERLAAVLYVVCDCLRALAVLFAPIMPQASERLWEMLGAQTIGPLSEQKLGEAGSANQLPAGVSVTKGAPLFPRIEV